MSLITSPILNYSLWRPRANRGPSAKEWDVVNKALAWSAMLEKISDRELTSLAVALREGWTNEDLPLDSLTQIEGMAMVREAVRRTTGRKLYPVQLLAGLILSKGTIAEMQTGEGKTLTSAVPGFLCAVRFQSVHVATPNAYLAERDCQELRPAYEMLGLKVGLLPEKHDKIKTRTAYQADVTYGTGYEFGFDFLRDQLAIRQQPELGLGVEILLSIQGRVIREAETSQAGHFCGLVDEIDSVLIDEAMTPLIISTPSAHSESSQTLYRLAMMAADRLERGREFQVDQVTKAIRLTNDGIRRSFDWLASPQLIDLPYRGDLASGLKRPWTQYIEQAIHAKLFLRCDVDYVVRDGKVEIVDQKTGRIFSERSWRAGLHQAVEMREGVSLTDEKASAARITRQRYFQLYQQLSGMTGTATGAEAEFREFYRLPVAVIPLNAPSRKRLRPDRFFASIEAKFDAIVQEAQQVHHSGQPVLIGTRTIADSERLSGLLTSRGLSHVVLNGKQDRDEAEIIGEAGASGKITIATNMAGRGTDIKPDQRALSSGGLHVIGVERLESRRVDRQLAGRAARAGAPGSATFFLSAEDELIAGHSPKLAKQICRAANKSGECQTDFSHEVEHLQAMTEHKGFLARRGMIHQDKWFEGVIDSLCRKTAK